MIATRAKNPLNRLFGGASRRSAIGIDIGSQSVKAVQLEQTRAGKTRVAAAMVRPRKTDGPFTSDEATELAGYLSSAGFLGNRVVLAGSADDVLVGPLELPPRSSQAPLDQLARMEVARNFRCAPDSFELSWWEMPPGIRGGRGTHALAVALPHARADALLEIVEPAGLEADALDTAPTALVRACQPVLSAQGVTAVLDLSWGSATLSFAYQGVLTFSRRLPEGAIKPLHGALCKSLGVEADVADYLLGEVGFSRPDGGLDKTMRLSVESESPLELPDEGRRLLVAFTDALVKELLLSFGYATHQYPDIEVTKLLLVGGGAEIAGLSARMSAALDVEAIRVSPAELTECDGSVLSLCSSPAFTLALGLAMQEVEK